MKNYEIAALPPVARNDSSCIHCGERSHETVYHNKRERGLFPQGSLLLSTVRTSLSKLKSYVEKENFKGYDPYDALNSPLLRLSSLGRKSLRLASTQLMKHLPFNLRPLIGIKKEYNPKALGLLLWGYAKLYQIEKKREHLEKINTLLDLLCSVKSKGYSGDCWGYNFPWQSRACYLPRNTPTVVNSSFIGHALLDTYTYTGIEKTLAMALSIKDFIIHDLNRTEENSAFSFSYTPLDHTVVHNANLLGASLLIRLYSFTKDDTCKDTALASLAYSMRYQEENGSWPYAETRYQQWIDSFHTGFNLQSILYFIEEGFGEEYKEAYEKGVDFYKDNFFLTDGTPKYFHNRVFPIDIHSPSQALVFFSRMAEFHRESRSIPDSCKNNVLSREKGGVTPEKEGNITLMKGGNISQEIRKNSNKDSRTNCYDALCAKILTWTVNNLQDERGFFYFQKRKYWLNRIPYMRWSQTWAFHGLTEYLMGLTGSSLTLRQ